MSDRIVEFEGRQYSFPADATDAEIMAAIGGAKSAPAPKSESGAPVIRFAGKGSFGLDPERPFTAEHAKQANQMMMATPLPALGSAAGGAVGALGGPAGAVAGGAAGAGVGEWLNQKIGITEPSAGQIALSAAAGPVAKFLGAVPSVASRAGKAALRRLPGSAKILHEEAAGAARQLPGKFAPPPGLASQLHGGLDAFDATIPMPNLSAAVDRLRAIEGRVGPSWRGEVSKGLDDLYAALNPRQTPGLVGPGQALPPGPPPGTMTFQQVRAYLKRIGSRTKTAQGTEADEMRGAYKLLTRAMHDDIEAAALRGGQGSRMSQQLLAANQLTRQEFAVETLEDLVERTALGAPRLGDGMRSFNGEKLWLAIERDDYLKQTLGPQALAEIRQVLNRFRGLPTLPPAPGEGAIGSGRTWSDVFNIAGVATGSALGSPVAGYIGAQATKSVVAKMISSPTGRRMLLESLDPQGRLTPGALRRILPHLATAGAAMTAEPGPVQLGTPPLGEPSPVGGKVSLGDLARDAVREEQAARRQRPEDRVYRP